MLSKIKKSLDGWKEGRRWALNDLTYAGSVAALSPDVYKEKKSVLEIPQEGQRAEERRGTNIHP